MAVILALTQPLGEEAKRKTSTVNHKIVLGGLRGLWGQAKGVALAQHKGGSTARTLGLAKILVCAA